MRAKWVTFLRGSVVLELRQGNIADLMTEFARHRIVIWDVKYVNAGRACVLSMHLADFFRLKPLLKKTGCRTQVVKREGLPFYLARLERRKFFGAGLALFVLGLYMLSMFVWQVQVEGNEKISEQTIIEAARKHGIYRLQWKPRLDDPSRLAKELMKELPEMAWIGVYIHGGRIDIRVVEADLPEEQKLYSPRHLVSTSDAVVTYILAEQGKPLVEPNTVVKKGQILISGMLGEGDRHEIVVAKGEVRGLVLYEYEIEVPLTRKHKTYTGNTSKKSYVTLGNRALQWSGFGKNKYEKYEAERHGSQIQWRKWTLPIGWMEETIREVELIERKISVAEAKQLGLQQAVDHVKSISGDAADVREQKILHEKSEDGKVYMKVLFEVEQEIMKELPIVAN